MPNYGMTHYARRNKRALLARQLLQGCVMSLVVSFRAWRLHKQQGERLEELAQTVQVRFWCGL